MKNKHYYGFEYKCGKNTTTGTCNPNTGNYSIAGEIKCFTTKQGLQNWINEQQPSYKGDFRTIVEVRLRGLVQTHRSFEGLLNIMRELQHNTISMFNISDFVNFILGYHFNDCRSKMNIDVFNKFYGENKTI